MTLRARFSQAEPEMAGNARPTLPLRGWGNGFGRGGRGTYERPLAPFPKLYTFRMAALPFLISLKIIRPAVVCKTLVTATSTSRPM